MTFIAWLMTNGTIDAAQLGRLTKEWCQFRNGLAPLHTYDTQPRTLTAFVARKYPKEFIVYQSYLRLTKGTKI
jgi:hypothetical protein